MWVREGNVLHSRTVLLCRLVNALGPSLGCKICTQHLASLRPCILRWHVANRAAIDFLLQEDAQACGVES